MKITKDYLRQVIKEELEAAMGEGIIKEMFPWLRSRRSAAEEAAAIADEIEAGRSREGLITWLEENEFSGLLKMALDKNPNEVEKLFKEWERPGSSIVTAERARKVLMMIAGGHSNSYRPKKSIY